MAQPEKKYGLIAPKKKLTVADVFKNDSDDETPILAQKKNPEKGLKKQTVIDMNRALLEDPTVYQYDEVYDTMKKTESETNKPKEERKTKYMDALLKSSDRRKKENERRTERLVQIEREAEGETFKDKEEFITSSYRKKLEEMKVAEEEEKKMEYIESVMDVSKQQDLGSFYRHLYKETLPEPEKQNDTSQQTEVKEEKEEIEKKEEPKGSSSSSSDTDSSSDSSSSDSSSTEQDTAKNSQVKTTNEKEAKTKTLEDGEIPSAADEDKSKPNQNKEKLLKFGSHSKRDRTYRQRDSNYKAFEDKKSPEREQKNGSHENRQRNDKGRDRNRERDRARDSERHRRDDRRSGLSWRSDERVQDERKNARRQRSLSRSNRDNHNRRNAAVKKVDKKDKVLDSKRKNISDKSGERKDLTEIKNDQSETNIKKSEKIVTKNEASVSSSDPGKENVEVIVDIWKKRTVGPVFEAALERYRQRKAQKHTLG